LCAPGSFGASKSVEGFATFIVQGLVADDDSAFGSLFWTIDRFFFILGSGMIKISNKNQFDWIPYEIKI
jgi:hypothetical protein